MKMIEKEEIREKLTQLKSESKDERSEALLGLSALTISDGLILEENLKKELYNNLNPLVKGEVECNLNDACYAAQTLAQLGYVSNYISYPLTTFLHCYAEDPVNSSGPMDEFMNSTNLLFFMVRITLALSLFKGNRYVLDELVDVVKYCLDHQLDDNRIKNLINACLRSIGAIGKSEDMNAITILEQFNNKGNITAKAALKFFGSSWEDIKNREIELKEKYGSKEESDNDLKSSGEFLAKIMNLCEDNPDIGLDLINLWWNDLKKESNPIVKWAKFLAYGSKGLFSLVRRLKLESEELEIPTWEGWEFKEKLKLNDNHLDYLESALIELKEIEKIDPSFVEKVGTEEEPLGKVKVEAVALALERCRPGRVQELLGKTKLQYFGAERIKITNDVLTQKPIDDRELHEFLDIFFEFPSIIKSAVVIHKGIENDGRKSIWIQLFEKVFNEFGPDETFGDVRKTTGLYDIILYNNGTFKVNPESNKKKSTHEFCTDCGTKIQKGSKFCTNCGKKLL